MMSTSLLFTWQTTALIYDKTSSMMQLTSGANAFRCVLVPKDDLLNFNANVCIFTIIGKIK